MNRYNKLMKQYKQSTSDMLVKDEFETYNVNAHEKEFSVSQKIYASSDKPKSEVNKIVSVDKVLLDYEYAEYKYQESGKFEEWRVCSEKIASGTIADKKNYSNKKIISAFKNLEELYNAILDEDMPSITKYHILYNMEETYRVEFYYKWLREFKLNGIKCSPSVLELLGCLYTFYCDKVYVKKYLSLGKSALFMSKDNTTIVSRNSIFVFNDVVSAYIPKEIKKLEDQARSFLREDKRDEECNEIISKDIDRFLKQELENRLNKYVDRLIVCTFIREGVMEYLEKKYDQRMESFDFYNCKELDLFLEGFITKGQYITFDKDLKKEIDMDTMRQLYFNVLSNKPI